MHCNDNFKLLQKGTKQNTADLCTRTVNRETCEQHMKTLNQEFCEGKAKGETPYCCRRRGSSPFIMSHCTCFGSRRKGVRFGMHNS